MPREANLDSLIALWPTFLIYGLSYLFVGTVWVNHHHLLRYSDRAEPKVIWANLFLLFFVSLIPFFTACMAETRRARFTTALYAGIFLLITISRRRNWIALFSYAVAIPTAWLQPAVSLAIIVAVFGLYFVPEAIWCR